MTILEEIISTLPAQPFIARRVVIGIHWTAVCSRFCGLASTLASENLPYTNLGGAGGLHNQTAQELAKLALSTNHYEATVGTAAINSLLSPDPNKVIELNAYDWLLDSSTGKNVSIVGHFPFVDKLRVIAKNLWVLEKNPRPGDIPAEKSQEYLSRSDIIAITGSTIINHSIDHVLSVCNPKAKIMILGPSTPLSEVLFAHGVSVISSTRVIEEEKALLAIEQGGSLSQIQGVKRISLFKEL